MAGTVGVEQQERAREPGDPRLEPVPFRIRIGVAGHRNLKGLTRFEPEVRAQIERIRALVKPTENTPVELKIVSSLAEGPDRLVAQLVLEDPGAVLEAPLPFPADDYRTDFSNRESVQEFNALLARARYAPERPRYDGEDRREGYRAVARYIPDRCDVLIAIWDRQPVKGPGGTTDVVERAVAQQVPVFHVDATRARKPCVLDEGVLDDTQAALQNEFRAVDVFNAEVLKGQAASPPSEPCHGDVGSALGGWSTAEFAQADALARRYRFRYRVALIGTFLLAAAAAAAVAGQVLLVGGEYLGWFEVVAILGLVFIVWVSHWRQFHPRYLGYRFLAERLREAPFLKLAQVDEVQPNPFNAEFTGYPSEGWPWRVFEEIWTRFHRSDLPEVPIADLSEHLAECWIGAQLEHHKRVREVERRWARGIGIVVVALFLATAAAAVLHGLPLVHEPEGVARPSYAAHYVLVFLSITLGACGAALSAFAVQRGYRSEISRSNQIQIYLEYDEQRMRSCLSADAIKRMASETEAHVLSESRSWFGDLLFEEIELHT